MLKSLIGGTPEELEDEYIKRSAFYWADEINVPIIILHGSDNWRVKQSQAQKIANELDKHGKEYKLIYIQEMIIALVIMRNRCTKKYLNGLRHTNSYHLFEY